jgi:hypothetical protein
MTTILKSVPFLATTYEDGSSSVASVEAAVLIAAFVNSEQGQEIVGSTEPNQNGSKAVKTNFISNIRIASPAGPNTVTVEFDFGEKELTEDSEKSNSESVRFSTIISIDYVK